MLKVKKNRKFFEKFLYGNEYNFIILPFLNKNIFKLNYIFHISKFKNFFNLNVKGNLCIYIFDKWNIFDIYNLLKKNNLIIFFFCFNSFFINYKNILEIQYLSLFYNIFLYFNYIFIMINVLYLCLYFLYDLVFFLKKFLY